MGRPSSVSVILAAVVPLLAFRASCADQDLATGRFPFADIDVYYQMYDQQKKDSPIVLFLHGAKFTSEHWVNLGTLSLLNKQGFRTIAVDLPGFGQTQDLPYIDNNMRAEFVKAALEFSGKGSNVTEVGAVLVTPSMSGKWAIPFLDRYGTMLKGWVAVAPVGVMNWGGPWEYTHKRVSLLALYGEDDPMRSQASTLLKLFGRARLEVIPKAGHAVYMDQPDAFHTLLSTFVATSVKAKDPARDL